MKKKKLKKITEEGINRLTIATGFSLSLCIVSLVVGILVFHTAGIGVLLVVAGIMLAFLTLALSAMLTQQMILSNMGEVVNDDPSKTKAQNKKKMKDNMYLFSCSFGLWIVYVFARMSFLSLNRTLDIAIHLILSIVSVYSLIQWGKYELRYTYGNETYEQMPYGKRIAYACMNLILLF